MRPVGTFCVMELSKTRVILGEALSGREILGCVMIFGAVILAQLPVQK